MEKSVGDLFDYINWRGDLSLKQSEFNAIDGLILSLFSYLQFEEHEDFREKTLKYVITALKNVPVREKMKIIFSVQKTSDEFLRKTVKMKRFKDIAVRDYTYEYDEETKQQFAAVTFQLEDGSLYIAFRGTDDSLVGWQEDCNLAFVNGVPSQLSATKYAQKIYDTYRCPIRLGGHSKGGNLAIWSAANMTEAAQRSIKGVFNFDGPGFQNEFLESDGFKRVKDKILSFVPESSIIGILMGHCDYLIVKSSAHSVLQHDPLSWNIIGKRFEYATERSRSGKELDSMINGFIRNMDKEQVAGTVNKIFEIMSETNIRTLDDMMTKKREVLKVLPKLMAVKKELKKQSKQTGDKENE